MKIIALPRGQGKTTQLIKMSAEGDGLYIVVPFHQQAVEVRNAAEAMELQIPFPLTIREVMQGQMGPGVKGILVDNMDEVLRVLFEKKPVLAGSVTLEESDGTARYGKSPLEKVIPALKTLDEKQKIQTSQALKHAPTIVPKKREHPPIGPDNSPGLNEGGFLFY